MHIKEYQYSIILTIYRSSDKFSRKFKDPKDRMNKVILPVGRLSGVASADISISNSQFECPMIVNFSSYFVQIQIYTQFSKNKIFGLKGPKTVYSGET